MGRDKTNWIKPIDFIQKYLMRELIILLLFKLGKTEDIYAQSYQDENITLQWIVSDDRIQFTTKHLENKFAAIGINSVENDGWANAEIVIFGIIPRFFDSQAYLHQYYGNSNGTALPETTFWRMTSLPSEMDGEVNITVSRSLAVPDGCMSCYGIPAGATIRLLWGMGPNFDGHNAFHGFFEKSGGMNVTFPADVGFTTTTTTTTTTPELRGAENSTLKTVSTPVPTHLYPPTGSNGQSISVCLASFIVCMLLMQ